MRLRAGALFVLLVAALWGSQAAPTQAYNLTGVRWDHKAITHNADPSLTQAFTYWAAVSGITDGGVSARPDIDISSALLPAGIGGYAQWSSSDGVHTAHCSIVVNTLYPAAMVVYVHELGHCLGLSHSCEGGEQGCAALDRTAIMGYADRFRTPWGHAGVGLGHLLAHWLPALKDELLNAGRQELGERRPQFPPRARRAEHHADGCGRAAGEPPSGSSGQSFRAAAVVSWSACLAAGRRPG